MPKNINIEKNAADNKANDISLLCRIGRLNEENLYIWILSTSRVWQSVEMTLIQILGIMTKACKNKRSCMELKIS